MEPKKLFEKYLKESVLETLRPYGFKKYKTSQIGRITSESIFEFFYFQKSNYGPKSGFTVSTCIMPLFVPREYIVLSLGDRLGNFQPGYGEDKWWQYKNEEEAKNSFQEINQIIKEYAMPWFNDLKDVKGLIKEYEHHTHEIPLGTAGWKQYDFALVYLKDNQPQKGKELLEKARDIFKKGTTDWQSDAVKKCDEALFAIESGGQAISVLLKKYEEFSRKNLGLINF